MYYRIRITYQTNKDQTITSTMNLARLPQLDTILRHLQNIKPGTLTVFWTEQEGI